MLLAVMPYEKVKGQFLGPNFTFSQSATNLCTGSVDFQVTSPNPVPSGYGLQYKINGVAADEPGGDFYFSPNQNGNVVTYNITCEVNNGNGYYGSYGPFYVSSVAGLYVKEDPTYINDCTGSITLDASINGAVLSNAIKSGIIWYEFNHSTHVSTQIGSSSQYLNLTSIGNGTHYYYYTSTNGTCTVQSGMYQVYELTTITIAANNSFLEPGTILSLSGANITTPPLYSNLQWYRNGAMIPGATSTSYTAIWPGDYNLYELYPSACGPKLSNIITITCNPAGIVTKTNFPFPTGTTTLSGYLKFDGAITIPAGAIVNINNAKIHMTTCSEIIIGKSGVNGQAGGRLNITNSSISGCDRWQWIKVVGNSGVGNPSQDGLLTLDNTQIRDADMAIYALDHGTLNINNTIFENNNTHMTVINCPNVSSTISNSKFSYWGGNSSCGIGNIYPRVNANYTTIKKMVYLSNASGISFTNTSFEPFILYDEWSHPLAVYSTLPNALEAYDCAKSVNAAYSFNIQSCSFKGLFNQGVYASVCESPLINGTTNVSYNIEGDFTNAFYFDQCNKPSIRDQKMHPGTGSQTYFRGILSYQSDGLYCYNNKVDGFERGLEFYQQIASSNKTTIEHNAFLNNDYGVVIAPEVFPVNNNANPNPNAAYYNNQRNVLLNCNKFYDCNWGVVGVGNIITQQTGNNGNDWDCFFTSNLGSNNYSKKADVAWYDYNNNINSVRKITIYYDKSTYPFTFSAQSVNLDGNTASSNLYYLTYVDERPNSYNGCRGSFKTDPLPPALTQTTSTANEVAIYPNPFSNNFTIKGTLSTLTNYVLYDMTGKAVMQGTSNGLNELQIDAIDFPLGCYLLKLTDPITGKNIQTTRLVKVSE